MDEKLGIGISGNGFEFLDKNKLIAEEIKRILLTRPGERVGKPEFGSRLLELIFEPETSINDVCAVIKYSIEQNLGEYVSVEECTLMSKNQETINIMLKLKINNEIIETEVEI